jgi:hypothetical protein
MFMEYIEPYQGCISGFEREEERPPRAGATPVYLCSDKNCDYTIC